MKIKLTEQEREEIRRLRKSGLVYREIAEMFRVSAPTVGRVVYAGTRMAMSGSAKPQAIYSVP